MGDLLVPNHQLPATAVTEMGREGGPVARIQALNELCEVCRIDIPRCRRVSVKPPRQAEIQLCLLDHVEAAGTVRGSV